MYFGCIIKLYIYFKQWRDRDFEYEVTERLWIQWEWDQMGYYNINNRKRHVKKKNTHLQFIFFYLFTVWVIKLHSRGYQASKYSILLICWSSIWMECKLTIHPML